MAFCPICRNEYRKGFTECHECKVPLVESLEEYDANEEKKKKQFDVNDPSSYDFLDQYKEENDDESDGNDSDDIPIVSFSDLAYKAKDPKTEEELMEEMEEAALKMRMHRQMSQNIGKRTSYVDKKQKIDDYKSSGYVLTGVGAIGIIALVLLRLGYLPGFRGWASNYMFIGVMGFMFLVFLVSGIMSFMQIKTVILEAEADDSTMAKITEFMKTAFTAEIIDKAVKVKGSEPKEEKYFKRYEYMAKELFRNFPDEEDSLREKMLEERYSELYEDDDN